MKKTTLALWAILLFSFSAFGQGIDSVQMQINAIEQSLVYKTGVVELESGNATLTVPKGFRYLDKAQSIYVLTNLWGNPADSSILGMLIPENKGVLDNSGWAFTISFDEIGYVEDDDADDIDYDDLLKEQQKEFEEANPERIKQGFQPIEFVGWASAPYYDKDKKVLHWAKELKFGQDSLNTLNYNLRMLGRKGIFVVNAVASMHELSEVKTNIDKVIGCVSFKEGHKYADFVPDVDNVAAWTIGGLVAGKILTKVGFFALLLKFWKLIAVAITGAGGGIWKFFKGKKKEESTLANKQDDIK